MMFKCEICGREFMDLCSLSKHIATGHKIKIEEYYLKFINHEKGKCKTCGKDTKFKNFRDGYSIFCSCKCSAINQETRLKSKNTCIRKYNCENVSQTIEVKEKYIQTCIRKYGFDNYSKTEEFLIKSNITCLKNFGVKHHMKNKEVKEKQKQTNIKNWGGHPMKNKEIKKKIEETCMKNLGVKHALQSPIVRKKSEETYMKKTGYKNPSYNPNVIKRILESTLKNNNGIHPSKLTFQKAKERYHDLFKIEELKEGSNGEILAHCKNSNCKNSKENGGYFEVKTAQISWRNDGINGHDTDNFYCCEECKHSCPLFGRSAIQLHNLVNENEEIIISPKEYSIFKNEVLSRQILDNPEHSKNFCEKCHSIENLQVHHIQPQKLEPGYALDPPNGIVLCQKCHFEIGHEKGTECSTGNLSNKLCK